MASQKQPDLSIVFPVHNEAQGIEQFLADVTKALKNESFTYEIICVENGSKDDSYHILLQCQKKYKTLRVVQSEKGWGNAVRKGIKESKGTYLCYMVSDGQVSPKYIPLLYKTIHQKNVALVKVTRRTRENTKRLVNSRAYNFLSFTLFQLPTQDINGTPKILKTALAQKMHLTSSNIAIDMEVLLILQSMHLRFFEIPIDSLKRETGISSTKIKTVFEMLKYMWTFILRFRIRRDVNKFI